MKDDFIIYDDESIIVINKPEGLLSVPGRGEDKQYCVVSILKEKFPGIVNNPAAHRLDMDTSGVMVYAKTTEALRALSIQFQQRTVSKRYIAVLDGLIKGDEGRIELYFRLDPDNRPYQVHDPVNGRKGITLWKKLSIEDTKTRIEFTPLTGRTHQLRVHSAHPLGLGHPICGDRLYGSRKPGERLLLHASEIAFYHPETGEKIEFSSPVPF